MSLNVVLYEPEIPGNTGNIMRTCAGTNTHLHLIEPLGFSLDEKYVKRSGVNYLDNCNYTVYKNYKDFKQENPGTYYFLTRYGKKTHSDFDYSDINEDVYFIFGKESTGIPKEILQDDIEMCLRIPTTDSIRALNLSNTVAIMVFEALRQRNYEGMLKYDVFKGKEYLDK